MDFDNDHALCALRRRLPKDLHGAAVCGQISDTRPRRNSNAAHLRRFQWARCRTWIIRMSPQPEPSTQEVLAGLVERITYHNAENGFCVLRARARRHRDVVTVIGHAATISAGEWITASGEWVNDRTHGQQFTARFLRTSPPTSADGIEKYLSSGMIPGRGTGLRQEARSRFWREGVRSHRDHTGSAARGPSGRFARPAFSRPGLNRRPCGKS